MTLEGVLLVIAMAATIRAVHHAVFREEVTQA